MSRQTVKIGEYKGFKYYVVKITDTESGIYNEWGDDIYWFRGQVMIPENHWGYKDVDWDLLYEHEVHGGISFTDWHGENSEEWVIEFDCDHDIEDVEYTENECKRLIDRIVKEEKYDRENNG